MGTTSSMVQVVDECKKVEFLASLNALLVRYGLVIEQFPNGRSADFYLSGYESGNGIFIALEEELPRLLLMEKENGKQV